MLANLATTVDTDDLEQRTTIIALRRQLAIDITELNRVAEHALAAKRSCERTTGYREQFSIFRRAVALHQTQWPTILISDDRPAFRASAQALRSKKDVFLDYMRVLIPQL